MCTI